MTIRHEPVPRLEDDDRLLVKPFGIKGFYRCVVRYGYQEAISQVRAPEHPLKGQTVELDVGVWRARILC
jgi:hypothetical protein